MIGLCVRRIPPASDLAELRPPFLRRLVYTSADITADIPLHLSLNNENQGGWNAFAPTCRLIAQRGPSRILGVDCGNELDRFWAINPADVPPSFCAALVNQAQAILGPAGIPVGTTTLGGPRWPEYLEELLTLCQPNYVALNPYGWIFESITAKVASVAAITDLPVVFIELGCKIGDAGGEQAVADALTSAAAECERLGVRAAWFAYHDDVGTPSERGASAFGLIEDGTNRRRPAFDAFAALAREEPTMPDLPVGIDVSNNNGHIDWAAVAAAGVRFGIAKVSEGTWFRDGYFAENWTQMKAHGLIRGAYHFAQPDSGAPEAQADYFVDAIGKLGQVLETGDLLALDIEAGSGYLGEWVYRFVLRVEERAGFKPLVYTSPAFIADHGLDAVPQLADYGLWLASWGVPTPPAAPAPWGLVAIHQYDVGGPGSVPGVAGECDLNRYNGPIETLPRYGKPGTVEPPQPAYEVGEGILAAMRERGSSPACDEVYTKRGEQDEWSEAFDQAGRRYIWLPSISRVFTYEPVA